MLDYALIQSYNQFVDRKLPYPFIEKRELKPRARIPGIEYESQKTFLVLFVEDIIPAVPQEVHPLLRCEQTHQNQPAAIQGTSLAR
jgi:hypothetical protein